MRGRWSHYILPLIVLQLIIFIPQIFSRPQNLQHQPQHQHREQQRDSDFEKNIKEFEWTSVERVSRSLTHNEMRESATKNERIQIGLVSKEYSENDENVVGGEESEAAEGRRNEVPLETDLSSETIKQRGREAFALLKFSNNLPEAIIDPPLKTHQMRLNEWEQRHHNKKGGFLFFRIPSTLFLILGFC